MLSFFGMGYAVQVVLPPLITADFFEGQGYGGIFGILMIFVGTGGGLWGMVCRFSNDETGSYVPVFIITIICAFFAA